MSAGFDPSDPRELAAYERGFEHGRRAAHAGAQSRHRFSAAEVAGDLFVRTVGPAVEAATALYVELPAARERLETLLRHLLGDVGFTAWLSAHDAGRRVLPVGARIKKQDEP